LKSPVHGIVNKLNVTTIGAVVQPGANLMDIIPLDDSLLVEGRIRPQDIAFIRPNQDAVVKISAYDSSVYGSLKGKVERISADTIVDDKEKPNVRKPSIVSWFGPRKTISAPKRDHYQSSLEWLQRWKC
jgi:adhesin transport system membrane fusion protein